MSKRVETINEKKTWRPRLNVGLFAAGMIVFTAELLHGAAVLDDTMQLAPKAALDLVVNSGSRGSDKWKEYTYGGSSPKIYDNDNVSAARAVMITTVLSGYGSSSLAEVDGETGILTIKHVLGSLLNFSLNPREFSGTSFIKFAHFYLPRANLYLDLTQGGFRRVTPSGFASLGSNYDPAIFAPFSEKSGKEVKDLMSNAGIEPVLVTSGAPKLGEIVAVPRITTLDGPDTFSRQIITGISSNSKGLAVEFETMAIGVSDYTCKGNSGTPILRMKGETITREVLGVVSRVPDFTHIVLDDAPTGTICSTVSIASAVSNRK